MSPPPQVSVVMPTHNRVDVMRVTLAAVLAQRGVDLEVLVVDDGSSDDTAQVMASADDPRVRLLRHEEPRGVGAARNTGIAAARGAWVAPTDDDDLWAPDKLATQLAVAEAEGRGWVFSQAVQFLPGPTPWVVSRPRPPEEVAARLPYDDVVPGGGSNVMFRRELADEFGGFDPALPLLGDWEMWMRLLRSGLPAVVPDHHVGYRLHTSNMSLTKAEQVDRELAIVDERHRDLRDGRPLDPSPVYRWLAVTYWRSGQRREERRMYLRALRAGDRSSAARALRTLVPVHQLRRRDVDWPEGAEAWLRDALQARYPEVG